MYGVWTVLPPILAIVVALLSKNVILALFAGMCSISVMTSGLDFLGPIGTALVDGIAGNGDVLMSFIPIGIMLYFMERGGGFKAFSKWSDRRVNSPTKAKGMALLLSVILSVNDYLADLTVGQIVRPVAQQNKVPRHKVGFIVANTANLTSLLPFSMYFLFCSGMIASAMPGMDGAKFYYQSIWFSFYTMLSIVTAVLFVLGIVPDIGPMKMHQKAALAAEDSVETRKEDDDGTPADFLAFVLPLAALFVTLIIYSVIQQTIVFLPGLWMGCIVSILYPLCRGTMKFSEMSGGIIRGFLNQAPVFLILMYVVGLVGSNMTKVIVPLAIFIIASLVSYSTGSLGTALVMMLPISLPLAAATGASLALTFGACYSGSQIGDQTSPISDVIIMVSGSNGVDPVELSKSFMPYRMIQFGICAVLFLVFGFIM